MIVKSEDLPQMKLDSHESLAENMHIRRDDVFGLRFLRGLFLSGSGVWKASVSPVPYPHDRKEHLMKANPKASPRINLKRILAAALFALLLAALGLVYVRFSEKPVSGSKAVTIEVISSAEKKTVYALRTDAQYLRQAMEEADGLTFDAQDGPYGLMVSAVNGETADYSKDGAYWGFSVNGAYCNYGIDQQPVHDGDAFTIAYTR